MRQGKLNIKKTIKKRIDLKQKPNRISINKYELNVVENKLKKINVVISAYDCADFIEECLDSVNNQTYKCNKILLGIDGCEKTLKKINEIRHKYSNLDIYYAEENKGPYQMYNALIELVPDDEFIQIFGADDIMNKNMLENMSKHSTVAISRHDGVLFIRKSIINVVGGFRDWKCAADSDMMIRLQLGIKTKIEYAPQHFFRREHDKQLTKHSETNNSSELRKSYINIYMDNKKSKNPDIYIEPVCSLIKKIEYDI